MRTGHPFRPLQQARCRDVLRLLSQHGLGEGRGIGQPRLVEGEEGGLVHARDAAALRGRHGQLPYRRTRVPEVQRRGLRAAAHELVDPRGLALPLHLDQVQLAHCEFAGGQHRLRGPGDQRAHAVVLGQALQAAREIDRVPYATELHLGLAADVARQDLARVEAQADRQLRQAQVGEVLVQGDQRLLLGKDRGASLRWVVVHVSGRVPEHKQPVAENLGDHPLEQLDYPRHLREVHVERQDQIRRLQGLRDACEVLHVREHDRDGLRVDVQASLALVAAQHIPHDGLRHESRDGLDAACQALEAVVHLLYLLHDDSTPLRGYGVQGGVQLLQPVHALAQLL
mmetsp:Transcript_57687/g.159679  ORF Transcript_57687/g.159679 Transcript_57687/m.159679 type:complete len:341 (-) Transcript_57687:87-1109(-)